MSDLIRISRSQYVDSLDCPRKVWWGYHYPRALTGGAVDGLSRKRLSVALTTGGAIHTGLSALLRGQAIDAAVAIAVRAYDLLLGPRGLDAEVQDDQAYLVLEQRALIEGLVRAWRRVRLDAVLDEYEVLDCEREELVKLSSDVELLARPDVVLRRKADDAIFILSFKTVSEARWLTKHEHDMQTISELVAVEARLGKTLAGVIVEGLLKGRRVGVDSEGHEVRDADKSPDRVIQRSPLIYGYKCQANPPLQGTAYDWQSTRKHGWHRFPVWEEEFSHEFLELPIRYGASFWVNWLPREVVESQIVTAPPILRTASDIDAWRRQIVGRARYDHDAAAIIAGGGLEGWRLDQLFPQNDAACSRFGSKTTRCQFYDACWTGNVGENPIASGLYLPRTPNHPGEAG